MTTGELGISPGDVLRGKYRITRVLGTGGMGVVVHATHLRLEQDVAIKLLRPEASRVPRVVERFAREAKAAARLRGEHVVRILDVDEGEGGAPFLVMEYLDGTDLDRLVRKRGPLPVEDAVRYALEACEGLAEAHALGIVHRDVKPANLFLAKTARRESSIKLLDFGISKAPESGDPTITEADRVLGSPSFMSPEQIKAARDVDVRTDVWALGVVLHFLLAGELPFEGSTATEVAARIASEAPRVLARPDVPAGLAEVVGRCLRKDPAARFSTVADLAHALAPFAAEGAIAARRVSSVLRLPVAPPSPPSTLDAAAFPGRETASLDQPASRRTDALPLRETASVDAPGPVSLGGPTADAARPPSRSEPPRRPSWVRAAPAAVAVLLLLVGVGLRGARSVPPTAPPASAAPPAEAPSALPAVPSAPSAAAVDVADAGVAAATPSPSSTGVVPKSRHVTPARRTSPSASATAPAAPDPLKLDLK